MLMLNTALFSFIPKDFEILADIAGMKWNLFTIVLSATGFSCLFGVLTCLLVKCGNYIADLIKKRSAEPA